MRYLGKLIGSLKEIFLVTIGQYILLFMTFVIFGEEKAIMVGSIILLLFQMGYIYWKLRKRKAIRRKGRYFPYVLLGIGIVTSFTMITWNQGMSNISQNDYPLILNILASGIVGPIYEEVLFRYSLIDKLEKFNKKRVVVILLASVIFGLAHTGLWKIWYGLIIGIINSFIYTKDKDLLKPIFIHMSANVFANMLVCYNVWIFFLAVILLIMSFLIIRRDNRVLERNNF